MTPGAPISLSEADRAALVTYLDGELQDALLQHHELVEQPIERWDTLYLAKPSEQRKNFPWDGACNVVLPLIGTTVDSVVARIVNTIFSVEPFWTVNPLHRDFQLVAKPTEDFLDWSRRVEFDLYSAIKSWCIEVTKYGWGWLKPRWDVSTQPYFRPNADGSVTRDDQVLRRAVVDHVLCQDVVAQAGIADELQGEWIAHRIRLTDGQVRWRVSDKAWDLTQTEVEDLLATKDDTSEVQRRLQPDGTLSKDKLNTVYEIWGDLPIGRRDKRPIPVRITYHAPSKQIVNAIYNPHSYGFRPLLKGTFIEREGRGQGLGIAQMLEPLQDEITTIHRQQVDNATLANTRFFLGRRGAIKPNTRIWPGRVLLTREPDSDLKAFQLGDTYQSMRALEMSVMAFAERRSGVSDPQLGREASPSSRATATGTLALIQEGNRRFDLNVRDMRNTLSLLGKTILQLNQQFRPKGVAYFVQGDDGVLTEATLDLPQGYIDHRLGVELTASTATINRQVEQQGLIALMQLQQGYAQEILSYAQIAVNPQMPAALREMAVRVADSRTALMERVMHTFDQKDAEALVPALEAMDALSPDVAPPGPAPTPGAPDGGAAGAGPDGGGAAPGLGGGLGPGGGPPVGGMASAA